MCYNAFRKVGERMIRYKIDVLAQLKDAGYNTNRIRTEKIMGEAMLQKIRKHELPSWSALNTICTILNCQPGDILEYVSDVKKD